MDRLRPKLDRTLATVLFAALAPAAVVIFFATRGWLNVEHAVMLGGLSLLTFAPAYILADFVLSLFDPSSS